MSALGSGRERRGRAKTAMPGGPPCALGSHGRWPQHLEDSISARGPRAQSHSLLPTEPPQAVLTGTFILKSSLLNLKARSERVLWKNPVGRRTRTSWRFAGKDACKGTERAVGRRATGRGVLARRQLTVGPRWEGAALRPSGG